MATRRRTRKTGAKSITVHHKRGSFKISVKVSPQKGKKTTTKRRTSKKRKHHRAGQFKPGGGRYKR